MTNPNNMPMKKYKVTLTSGRSEIIEAQAMTYDNMGNLNFFSQKKTLVTHDNPDGVTIDLVKCYNQRHYESYEYAPILN